MRTDSINWTPDGSYAPGPLLNQYLSETWERPSGCVARNVNGESAGPWHG